MGSAWDRREDETSKAFKCFTVYRDMGEGRNVDKAYQKHNPHVKPGTRGSASWYAYCSDFDWVNRAKLFDAHLLEVRKTAIEDFEKSEGVSIARDRVKHKREEAVCASLGLQRAREILEMEVVYDELHITTTKDGTETKKVLKKFIPAPLLFAAVGLMQASSKVGRQALGIEDNEGGGPVSLDEWRQLFYTTRQEMRKDLPAGAMPNPPPDPSAKPVLHLAGKSAEAATSTNGGSNGNGNALIAWLPQKARPSQ